MFCSARNLELPAQFMHKISTAAFHAFDWFRRFSAGTSFHVLPLFVFVLKERYCFMTQSDGRLFLFWKSAIVSWRNLIGRRSRAAINPTCVFKSVISTPSFFIRMDPENSMEISVENLGPLERSVYDSPLQANQNLKTCREIYRRVSWHTQGFERLNIALYLFVTNSSGVLGVTRW